MIGVGGVIVAIIVLHVGSREGSKDLGWKVDTNIGDSQAPVTQGFCCRGRLIMNGGAKFGHLLAAFCFGSFFAGFSKSDCEALYQGRYSPNLLAATLAVVAGCMVHYCKE